MAPRPCEVCKNSRFSPYSNRRKVLLERCQSCGFLRQQVIPALEDLEKLYTRDYYKSWGLEKNEGAVESMKRLTFAKLLDVVEKHRPKKGTLLDVGCATGFLMAEAKDRGWDVCGVEKSDYSAKQAQNRFPGQVHHGSLEDGPFSEKTFDVITLIDLLEHVPDPVRFLDLCSKRLKAQGLLVIGTPNTASFTARLFGGAWEHLKAEHIYYWSKVNLTQMLERRGFQSLECKPLTKALHLDYLNTQLTVYPLPLFTPTVKWLHRMVSQRFREKPFRLTIGEMLLIARRA